MKNINERLRNLERQFKAAAERDANAVCAVIYPESIINDSNEIYYFPQGIRSAATHISGNWDAVELFINEHQDIKIRLDFGRCLEWRLVRLIEDEEITEKRKINFARAIIEAEPQCALLLRPEYGGLYEFIKATPMIMYKKY